MADTLVVKHAYMGKPLEQRVMHQSYFLLGGDGWRDPHCVHAVSLADVCPECEEAT